MHARIRDTLIEIGDPIPIRKPPASRPPITDDNIVLPLFGDYRDDELRAELAKPKPPTVHYTEHWHVPVTIGEHTEIWHIAYTKGDTPTAIQHAALDQAMQQVAETLS